MTTSSLRKYTLCKVFLFGKLLTSNPEISYANSEVQQYSGSWQCFPEEVVVDGLRINNTYELKISQIGFGSRQIGKTHVHGDHKSSTFEYELVFDLRIEQASFTSTLRQLDHSIVNDELNLFSNGVEHYFPSIYQSISGDFLILENGNLRSVYTDGTVIDCHR